MNNVYFEKRYSQHLSKTKVELIKHKLNKISIYSQRTWVLAYGDQFRFHARVWKEPKHEPVFVVTKDHVKPSGVRYRVSHCHLSSEN